MDKRPEGVAVEDRLAALRPRLYRYCARMVDSSIDGEDAVQDTMVKALRNLDAGAEIDHFDAWVFRIAHNASLDMLRGRRRCKVLHLNDDVASTSDASIVAVGFDTFLRLPELQRCAVILKDVLGYSLEEVAAIAECTPGAAKSALQRGRVALRQLAAIPADTRLPLMEDGARQKMALFVDLFRKGDFDAIRENLAEDVRLDLANRLQWEGRDRIAPYFTRYAEEPKWTFSLGAVEGRPAMLVFDRAKLDAPSHFVLVEWRADEIVEIRDFLFAPYVVEPVDWARLGDR